MMLKWMWSWASWTVTRWMVIEMYHHLKRAKQKQIVISGFRKARITAAVRKADQLAQLCENLFAEIFMVTNWKHFWLILSTVAILNYVQFHLYLWGRKISIFVSFYNSLLWISLYYVGERKKMKNAANLLHFLRLRS